jgi:CubicO group peptidase (beta-lactamase class C family)
MLNDVMGRQYGYGFQIWDTKDTKVFGHTGGASGISAGQYILPESGYVIIVLSNYDGISYPLGEAILKSVLSVVN